MHLSRAHVTYRHCSSQMSFDEDEYNYDYDDNLWKVKIMRLIIKQSSLTSCYSIKNYDIQVLSISV